MGQIKNIKLHIVTDIKVVQTASNHKYHEEEHQRLIITKKMPQGLLLSSQQCAQKVDVCSTFKRTSIQILSSFHAYQKGRRSVSDTWTFQKCTGWKSDCCVQEEMGPSYRKSST